ncbi:MAG: hypothetical protein IJ735_07680 [Clostridia bacterium]|nr:hypothetical protein [Clostridia bacterium]
MRKILTFTLVVFMLLVCLSACGDENTSSVSDATSPKADEQPTSETADPSEESKPAQTEEDPGMKALTMKIGGTKVSVGWEENASVEALTESVKDKPLTIQMSMYGGFEQVGSIGKSLPRNDAQTTTQAGDIVLYSGNQIVIFYGSNSWAYTKLGHITDKNAAQMRELLGNGNVIIELSLE